MKTIIYFHGYGSTGESGTVVYLRKHLKGCQIIAPDILKKGTFEFFQPRIDGTTEYTVDDNIIEHYREMEQHMYDELTPEDAANVYGLFGDGDTTVNFRDEWKEHFDNFATFEGEHRMNNRIIRDTVLPLVQKLLES